MNAEATLVFLMSVQDVLKQRKEFILRHFFELSYMCRTSVKHRRVTLGHG